MSERLRCGVIGTGARGLQHLDSILHCPRSVAVGIADISAERAKEAAERYKLARSYLDYHDLLDQPDIDAVTIAVPDHLHAKIACEAIKARKHVFLESPMALNVKEASRIAEASKKARRTFMVSQPYRFHRETQAVKALVQKNDLGDIYHARCFWLRRSGIPRIGSWFTQKQTSAGGCLAHEGLHMLDTCLHLLGEFEVKSVFAQTAARFGPRGAGEGTWGHGEIHPKRLFEVEDYGVALLKLKSGKTIQLESSWAGNFPADGRQRGVDLFGTTGSVSVFPARIFRSGLQGQEIVHLNLPEPAHAEDAIHHFATCVVDGKKPAVTIEESLRLQKVLDGMYASASSGKEVRMT